MEVISFHSQRQMQPEEYDPFISHKHVRTVLGPQSDQAVAWDLMKP